MENENRRKFLLTSLGALGAAAAAAILYPLLRYLSPSKGADASKRVTLKLADIPEGEAKYFEQNGSSGVLVRLKGGNLAVFSAVCTHLGCIVQWQKGQDQFLCPCHGGLFSKDGAVISGPPPKPLEKLPFVVDGDSVTIG